MPVDTPGPVPLLSHTGGCGPRTTAAVQNAGTFRQPCLAHELQSVGGELQAAGPKRIARGLSESL